jgi:hypothetical protein
MYMPGSLFPEGEKGEEFSLGALLSTLFLNRWLYEWQN